LVSAQITLWALLGWALLPAAASGGGWLSRLGLRVAAGMAGAAALASVWGFGRVSYFFLLLLVPAAFAAWFWTRRPASSQGDVLPPPPLRSRLLPIAVLVLAACMISRLDHPITDDQDRLMRVNDDLGYFAQTAKALPEARVASIWAAVLGRDCAAAGETRDAWYHWGPMWLTSAAARLSGLSEMVSLARVTSPALNIALALVSAGAIARLTGWDAWRSLGAGALSIIAVSLPSMSWAGELGRWLPGEPMPHFHPSLAYQFSYKFEGVLVLAAAGAWLGGSTLLALMFVFAASVSAPHTVAGCGLAAGMLGLAGLALRRRDLTLGAAGLLGTILGAWAVVHFAFGVGLPKTGSAQLMVLEPATLLKNAGLGLRDALIGMLLAAPVAPGLWSLMRDTDPRRNLAGWLAVSGLAGSYMAYHLLLPTGDRAHFTMHTHALLVMPAGFWGLATLLGSGSKHLRLAAAALLALTSLAGIWELRGMARLRSPLPLAASDWPQAHAFLAGRTWGYFAERDRNWWIPQQSVLAGFLDSRCARLNEIPEKDSHSEAARFYGAGHMTALAPAVPGETPLAWSLRLASRLGISRIVATKSAPLPDAARPLVRELLSLPELTIYALEEPETEQTAP
jgi:hypothetical protein